MKSMIRSLLMAVCFIASSTLIAQRVLNLHGFQPEMAYENVSVHKLDTDAHASTYIIWVKKSVKEHFHKDHTEIVYVLEGQGEMTLGDQTHSISPGDYIFIPKGTHHSVRVTSTSPMKVLSVQTPEFDGSDRVFVTQE